MTGAEAGICHDSTTSRNASSRIVSGLNANDTASSVALRGIRALNTNASLANLTKNKEQREFDRVGIARGLRRCGDGHRSHRWRFCVDVLLPRPAARVG